MPTTPTIRRGDDRAAPFGFAGLFLLFAALVWPAVSGGAHAGSALAATQLLVLLALLAWVLGMVAQGRLEWRRTALDLPLGLLLLLVLAQLAIGNGPLRDWALAPPATGAVPLPSPMLALGTVSPGGTARSLLLFLTYAGTYALTVNLVRRRRDLDRLVRALLLSGGILAFLSVVDYLSRETWIFRWRQGPVNPRLSGPFVNPDHWASWLVMLLCLGVGYLAARSAGAGGGREAALRRYLPAAGVAIMGLAAVFTLSRGALLAAFAAGGLLLFGVARVRGLRWSLTLSAALGAALLGYLLWIGIDPLLARFGTPDRMGRLPQWQSSLPMLTSFPMLGVGLGAYKDVYFRFQPAALLPGRVYFPYAHSDLLQLALETGPAGLALFLWAVWRVGRDLVGAHLLGRGRCPAGPEGSARRTDPFSVGIMLGALGAVVALLAHSAVDFSARIPADGLLAAACLGMATVAAHTRFTTSGAHALTESRECALGRGILSRAAVGAAACILAAGLAPLIIEAAMPRPAAATVEGIRRAIASTPSDPYLHERLAWALELQGTGTGNPGEVRRASRAHMERAVALQPESALLRRSQSALALAGPEPSVRLSIEAGRAAVERDPALLGNLVELLAPLALTDAQWIALVPPSAADRAQLAGQLESHAFLHEARAAYESALEGASAGEEPVIRWALAQLLLGVRRPVEALAQMDAALAKSPGNPELLLTRARALDALGRPETLDAYRSALAAAEGRSGPVFAVGSPRLQAAVAERLPGRSPLLSVTRYRRAYAQRLTDEQQWSPALAEWERAQAEAPLAAREQFSRGLALDATGSRARAIEALRQAVTLEGSLPAFRARLAARLWDNEQYVEAVAQWQQVTAYEPGNLEARVALARAYLKMGDSSLALAEYRRVLALAPNHAEARQAVARLAGAR